VKKRRKLPGTVEFFVIVEILWSMRFRKQIKENMTIYKGDLGINESKCGKNRQVYNGAGN
jgi:hypothetical protein